jgi:hypothetical protein
MADVKTLDCESRASTDASLQEILGIKISDIYSIFNSLDLNCYYRDHPHTSAAPDKVVLNEVLKESAAQTITVDNVCWFHLSRVSDPEAFQRDGILPLNMMLDSIWEFICSLVPSTVISPTSWDAFRHGIATNPHRSARLYASKVENRLHWGPYAILIRDIAFRPAEIGNHDYLRAPEIVEDICRCFQNDYKFDLLSEFQKRTKSCVIKFATTSMTLDRQRECVVAALYHQYQRSRGLELNMDCNTCWDNNSSPILASKILKIDKL